MHTIIVEYSYDAAQPDRIAEVRPEHREFLAGLHAEGTVLASGPVTSSESPAALLILSAPSEQAALTALDADPFLREGLITERSTRVWDPVIGPWA